ncbi:MAG: hypothetical protein AAF958_03325 [Planctomycetota bacterium]
METTEPGYFRCQVPNELSNAHVRAGRRKFRAGVQETSIDGYTILVGPKEARKLKVGKPWILEHQGASIEVHPQWFFNSPDGHVQIGLRRLRDLTPPEPIRRSLLVRMGGVRYANPSVSATAYGGFVLGLFLLLALPGLGDRLGTSDRIQNTLRWVVGEVNKSIDQM